MAHWNLASAWWVGGWVGVGVDNHPVGTLAYLTLRELENKITSAVFCQHVKKNSKIEGIEGRIRQCSC